MLDLAPKRKVLAVAQHFDQLRKQGVGDQRLYEGQVR